jgi:hypothetical protein
MGLNWGTQAIARLNTQFAKHPRELHKGWKTWQKHAGKDEIT